MKKDKSKTKRNFPNEGNKKGEKKSFNIRELVCLRIKQRNFIYRAQKGKKRIRSILSLMIKM